MDYAVVYFEEDKQYSEIPSNWLTDNNTKCFWPPKNVKNYYSLIRTRTEPSDSWELFDVKVETFCRSLGTARGKAANKEYISSEENDRGRGMRRVLTNNEFSSEDEEESCITPPPTLNMIKKKTSQNMNADENVFIQSVDIINAEIVTVGDLESGLPQTAHVIFSDSESFTTVPKQPVKIDDSKLLEKNLPLQLPSSDALRSDMSETLTEKINCNAIASSEIENGTSHSLNMPSNNLSPIEKLTRMTSRILMYVRDIDERLSKMEEGKDASRWDLFREKLPCDSLEDVNSLAEVIQTSENENAFKYFIKSIGGMDTKDRVTRVMKTLITNKFGMLCSWQGQRNNIKASDFKCIRVAMDVLVETQSITQCEFSSAASEWFRLSRLRFSRQK